MNRSRTIRLITAAVVPAALLLGLGCDTGTSTTSSNPTPPAATTPSVPAASAATSSAAAPSAPTDSKSTVSKTSTADVQASLAKAQTLVDKSVDYLKSQQQPNGGWQKDDKQPPAVTALVLRAIVGARPADRQADYVKKGYDKLLSFQLENGGIYKDLLANYNTAIAVSALAAVDNPAYKPQLDKAVAYLKGLQLTDQIRPEYVNEKEQFTGKQVVKDDKDPFYGGFGYGGPRRAGAGRPDLSNTAMALEALHEAGLKPEDPAFQNAVKFITRTQNRSESNDQKWSTDDGGFIYGPGDQRSGESMAGTYTDDAGQPRFRSYGSMTYAAIKSMIYAGLTKQDPRVKAAFDWVAKNWTLDENPGMKLNKPEDAKNGLFYYYHTFAKALNANNEPVITDAQGKQHDWRMELIDKLASMQQPDGSFVGDKRFMEDNPVLVTSYAAMALQEAVADLKEHAGK